MLQRLVSRLRRRLFPSKAELLEASDLKRLAIFTGYARLGFPKDPGVEEVTVCTLRFSSLSLDCFSSRLGKGMLMTVAQFGLASPLQDTG